MRHFLLLGSLLLVAALTGCQDAPPPTIAVTGIVTLDGVPCADAVVTFVPTGETKGNGGAGYTDAEGKFTAHLHDGQTGQGPPGLLPGKYKVVINKSVNPDGTPAVRNPDVAPIDSTARELLPSSYSNYDQTTLQLEISDKAGLLAVVHERYDLKSGK